MSTTEDRLRAAFQAATDTLTPGSVPPLRLPPGSSRQGGAGRGARVRRLLRTATPLAAAASVLAVLAVTVVINRGVPGHRPAPAAQADGVPRYYLDLGGGAGQAPATIRATGTGRRLAVVPVPRPYGGFDFVSGAADDRTWVLAAQRLWSTAPGSGEPAAQHRIETTPVAFFLVRFDPATGTTRLTRLSRVPAPQAAQLQGIGLAPDAGQLALALRTIPPAGQTTGDGARIELVTLATGSVRTWTWPGQGWIGNMYPSGTSLSWTADGRELAFQAWVRVNPKSWITGQIRVLDVTAPGGSLRAASHLVWAFPYLGRWGALRLEAQNALITPDGSQIVAATAEGGQHQADTILSISEFSVHTSRPLQLVRDLGTVRLGPDGGGAEQVLWTNSSGSTVIADVPRGAGASTLVISHPGTQQVVGILTRRGLTRLPWLSYSTINVAW